MPHTMTFQIEQAWIDKDGAVKLIGRTLPEKRRYRMAVDAAGGAGKIAAGDRIEADVVWADEVWGKDAPGLRVTRAMVLHSAAERRWQQQRAKDGKVVYGNPEVRGERERGPGFTQEDREDRGETDWPRSRQPEHPALEFRHLRRD